MNTVPIQEAPIPEVFNDEQLAARTLELLQHDIPGFIIRRELQTSVSSEQAKVVHEKNVVRLQAEIEELHPDRTIIDMPSARFDGLGQDPVGAFRIDVHSDVEDVGASEILDRTDALLHTTLTGGGKVTIAHMGTNPQKVYKEDSLSAPRSAKVHKNSPHNVLLDGRVDPEMVSPKVYSSDVGPGDSVVISAGNSKHAAWHRMDTDQTRGERKVRTAQIIDNTKGYSSRKNNNDYEGLDVPKAS